MKKRWQQMSPRWRKFIMIAIVLIIFILVAIRVLYWSIQMTVDSMYEEVDESSILSTWMGASGTSVQAKNFVKPITVLLLGVDERPSNSGRSDTMMVLALNPEKKTTKMLSIPRDTLTKIEGYREADKINHAYAFGGASVSKKTVEQLLNIPIDYVITVNMEGLVAVIDQVGGVTVTNPFSFNYEGMRFDEGELNLTGFDALRFVRMRYDDPDGDFGRQDRQKNVVKSLLQKLASPQSLLKLPEFLDIAKTHVRMNIRFEEIATLHKLYRESFTEFESIQITKGHGETRNGIYYYILNKEELSDIQKELQTFIAIEPYMN